MRKTGTPRLIDGFILVLVVACCSEEYAMHALIDAIHDVIKPIENSETTFTGILLERRFVKSFLNTLYRSTVCTCRLRSYALGPTVKVVVAAVVYIMVGETAVKTTYL